MPLWCDVPAFKKQGITSLAGLGEMSATDVAELCDEVGMKPLEKRRLMTHHTAMVETPATLTAFLKAAKDTKYLKGP